MSHWTGLITFFAVLFYFGTAMNVGNVRRATGIKAPATIGNDVFERAYRVQMNTLEWMPIMLPGLWLFALYVSDAWAAAIGGVWILGRMMYLYAYMQAASKRGPGFGIQALAVTVLWIGALYGIVSALVHLR